MRNWRLVTLLIAVVAVLAVGGRYAAMSHSSSPKPRVTPTPLHLVSSTRPSVLASLPPAAAAPTSAGVTADLAAAVGAPALGRGFAGDVVDVTTGTQLWARSAKRPEPPASTTKLLTAAAALETLGADYRLTTRTVRLGRTVFLIGGGDVTLVRRTPPATAPAYPKPASLAVLARATSRALAGSGPVRVRLDATAWGGPRLAPGWSKDYVTDGDITPPSALEVDEGRRSGSNPYAARSRAPVTQAGRDFARLLRADGVRVLGRPTMGRAPSVARPIASVQSPPLADLVQRMLTVSDNDLAEALGRTVAINAGKAATFAGAAAAVTAKVAALGVPVRGLLLHDTSGLSYDDRLSPATLVGVLQAAASAAHAGLRPILEGLPVAGFTGTLAPRYRKPPARAAAGVLRAKTGTLTGVSSLAGVVVDQSGRLLEFAFIAPHAPATSSAEAALDRLAARLVRCGCVG